MVTRKQVTDTIGALEEVAHVLAEMQRLCELAAFQYQVGTALKSLPESDVTTLYGEYGKLKVNLQAKVATLP